MNYAYYGVIMIKIIISCLVVILTLAVLSCDENNSDSVEFGRISGYVIDKKTGDFLDKVVISTEPPTESVVSNSVGEFLIQNVEPGNYILYASKHGYVNEMTNIKVQEGKTTTANIALVDVQTNNNPPEMPENPFPTDGSKINSENVTISWDCTDPDDDPITYEIYFGENNPPVTKIATGIKKQTYTIEDLKDSTKYYWKVIAKDFYEASTEGPIWSFYAKYSTDPVKNKGLIAHYTFDGNANDNGPYGYHGHVNKAVLTTNRFGKTNSAYHFNGNNSCINISEADHFNFSNDFTFALWIKPDYSNCSAYDGHIDIISRAGCSGTSDAYYFGITSGKGLEYWVNNNGSLTHHTSSKNAVIEEWTHIAAVFKAGQGKNGTVYFYVNGTNIGSGSIGNCPSIFSCGLRIGSRHNSDNHYAGAIDDIYIYDIALSTQEINELIN